MTPEDTKVLVVRVYLTEHGFHPILEYLTQQAGVRGLTVFRGISGVGSSGKLHAASLLDLSLDLPVVVEFFDTPAKVTACLPRLSELAGPGHVVYWPASVAGSPPASTNNHYQEIV